MDFSDIEKAQREAFDYLIANSPESEFVKNVSIQDASSLIDELEKLRSYLNQLDLLFVKCSKQLEGVGISDINILLSDFYREIGFDIEHLKRKHV
jgi:hypothetical protein